MTTLAALMGEIADDLDRDNEDTVIESEVGKAIRYYQNTRFYFNETRDETFNTVASQKLYTSTDDAAIPLFIEFDQITLLNGTTPVELDRMSPEEWELLTASGTSVGLPTSWCYFNRSIGLFPIPDAAYTIRMSGHIIKSAPAAIDEANNVWMTEAFDLLRARVCHKIGLRKTRDAEVVAAFRSDEMEELGRLKSETASRVGTGRLIPTEF